MAIPQNPKSKIWIPPWLHTSNFCFADGQPHPRMLLLQRIYNYVILAMTLGAVICGLLLWPQWGIIDQHLCSSIQKCQDPCIVQADPDIAGIGVRIATYIQSYCGTIILGFSAEDTKTVRGSIVLTSLGIVATTAIFALQGSLNLESALIIGNLLTLDIFPLHVIESWRVRSPGLFVAQQIRLWVYLALEFWLVFRTPCLGREPRCNQCVKTFFIIQGHAVNSLRRAANVAVYIMTVTVASGQILWTYGLSNYLESFLALFSDRHAKSWLTYVTKNKAWLDDWRDYHARADKGPWLTKIWIWYDDETTVSQGIKARLSRQGQQMIKNEGTIKGMIKDAKSALQVPRCQRALVSFFVVTLYVYNTEQIVRANMRVNDADHWGYGQISTVVLTIPCVTGCLKLFFNYANRTINPMLGAHQGFKLQQGSGKLKKRWTT